MTDPSSVLTRLMAVIEDRKQDLPDRSYTARLLAGGVDAIAAKISEEAAEVIEAASEKGEEGRGHLVHEASDLVYHLLVMLAHRDIGLNEVEAELARRFGVSGIEEKESRQS